MIHTFTNDREEKARAERALAKMKKKEAKLTFFTKKVGERAVVSCLTPERLEEFSEYIINNNDPSQV